MRVFLIIYTVLYLFLEVAFRSRLLDVTGSVSDGLTVETLEITGRLIASLGFSILIISKFNFGKNRTSKIFYNTIAYLLSFIVFFYAQKHTVDFAVSQIPDDFKKNAILLSVFKENVFFNKDDIKGVTDGNAQPSSNEKIFLSTLPIVNISNDKYINVLTVNQKQLFGNNIIAKLENADKELAELEFNLISIQLRGMWNVYRDAMQANSKSGVRAKEQQKEIAIKRYEELAGQSWDLYRNYKYHTLSLLSGARVDDFINSTFSNDGNFKVAYEGTYSHYEPWSSRGFPKSRSKFYPLSTLLNLKEDKEDDEYFNSKIDFIEYFQTKLYYEWNYNAKSHVEYMHRKAEAFLGLSREKANSILNNHLKELDKIKGKKDSLCYESNTFPKAKLSSFFKKVNESEDIKYGLIVVGGGNDKYLYKSFEIDDDSLSDRYLICDTTKIEYEVRKALMRFAVKVNKYFYGFSHDINSYQKYRKTFFGKKDIQKLYRRQNMLVPLGFNPADKKGFEKYYKESIKNRAKNIVTSKLVAMADMNVNSYVRKHGEISTSLNEAEFYRLPIIQIILDKKFPNMLQKKGYIMMNYSDSRKTPKWHKNAISNKDKMINDFINKKEKYNGGYLYQIYNSKIEDDKVMDLYAKSIVVPTFVLLISTIMIVINIANLILLSLNTTNTKNKTLVLSSIFALFLALSMLNDNNKYTEYYKSLEGDTNASLIVLASVLQNTNALFESIGFFNNIINDQINNFEEYAVIDEIEGHDIAKKYRDLKNGIRVYYAW